MASAGGVVQRRDGNDVKSRLDIRVVTFEPQGRQGVLSIKTYDPWRCRYLREEGLSDSRSASLRWRFDLEGGLPSEMDGGFECRGSRVVFDLPGRPPLKVSRPNLKTARFRLPLRWLQGDRSEWVFYADSRADGMYRSQVLFDEVDDSGPLAPFGG
jgi:hypothetical protein